MKFIERIRQSRNERQLPQRRFAAASDTASYCKIEKRERRARKEQIPVIAKIPQADNEGLLTFWLADKVVADEKEVVG